MAESNREVTPVMSITAKKGGYLEGKIVKMGREVKIGPNKDWLYYVYELSVADSDLPVQVKKDGKYVDTDINEGDTVSFFATKKLHALLSVFDEGAKVRIVYNGKKDTGQKNPAHDFTVKMVKGGN